jgi:DNA-binding NtrC family response regulator
VLLAGARAARSAEIARRLPLELTVEGISGALLVADEGVERLLEYDALLLDTEGLPASTRPQSVHALLELLRTRDRGLRVVALVGDDDPETARTAAAAGAWDVVTPAMGMDYVTDRLCAAAALRSLDPEPPAATGTARQEPARSAPPPALEPAIAGQAPSPMLGACEPMQRVFSLIRRLATTDVPVLITGESGTGKELAALAIHERSARARGPFVPINCAALPEMLVASELFGHEQGAFTGAIRTRPGRVEAARGGTLLLDEIGELTLSVQVKLLRFLEDHSIERIGGQRSIPVDVRVIGATHRDLAAAVDAGEFRKDLYYRLNVFTLSLPPLRERGADVILLARDFLARVAAETGRRLRGFTPEAIAALARARWPGNVRELRNCIQRAAVLAEGDLVTAADLDLEGGAEDAVGPTLRQVRTDAEVAAIRDALRRARGSKSEAARLLDISRTQLYDMMNRYDIPDDAATPPTPQRR